MGLALRTHTHTVKAFVQKLLACFLQVREIVHEEISAGNVLPADELSAVKDALKLDAVIKEVDK